MTRNLFGGSCCGDYSRIFADATCSVDTDTPWGCKKSHRFHRYTQIFRGRFWSRRFRRWRRFFFIGWHGIDTDFFVHRMTRNLFGGSCCGDYSRIFADATCSVDTDTPWDRTKRFTRDPIKNLWKSVESVGHKTPTKKNLRHLRNLRDKTIAAPFGRQPLASGQISAKICE